MDKKKKNPNALKVGHPISRMVSLRMPLTLIKKLDQASSALGISKTAIICEGIDLRLK